jgi:hypothetical protein
MKRNVTMCLSVTAALMVVAVLAPAVYAKSTDNPQWVVCEKVTTAKTGRFTSKECTTENLKKEGEWESKVLKSTESRKLTGKVSSNWKVDFISNLVLCKTASYGGSFIDGSTAPNAGTAEGSVELGECREEGSPECIINNQPGGKATVKTEATLGKLVFTSREAAEEEKAELKGESTADILWRAVSGKTILKIVFGRGCKEEGTFALEGEALEHFLGGPEREHLEGHNTKMIGEGTYWENSSGKSVEKTALLSVLGFKGVVFTGEATLELSPSTSWWLLN